MRPLFKLLYTGEAKKQIERLNGQMKLRVREAVERLTSDPSLGKHLTGELSGRSSYRVGDYRIIYRVYHKEILILILAVGHRRNVYDHQSRKH